MLSSRTLTDTSIRCWWFHDEQRVCGLSREASVTNTNSKEAINIPTKLPPLTAMRARAMSFANNVRASKLPRAIDLQSTVTSRVIHMELEASELPKPGAFPRDIHQYVNTVNGPPTARSGIAGAHGQIWPTMMIKTFTALKSVHNALSNGLSNDF